MQKERGEECYLHADLVNELRTAQDRVKTVLKSIPDDEKQSINSPLCINDQEWVAPLYSCVVKIQAPMVRYSRPAFRKLCRLWGTDISYTHMIMANSFTSSSYARNADFALYQGESKLIVQLASRSGPEAAQAAAMLQPYCDAIDLNCGCPQKWAIQEGIGSAMLEKPEQVVDIVRCIRNGLEGGTSVACVVKMRVKDDIRQSVEFARQCVAAGASWLTVHGRTPQCAASAPMRWESVKAIGDAVDVPVVANGAVSDPRTALWTALRCESAGVMSANGLLDNPAAFYVPQANDTLSLLPYPRDRILGSSPLYPNLSRKRFRECSAPSGSSLTPRPFPALKSLLLPRTPIEVISDFLRLSVAMDLSYTTCVQHFLRMSRVYLSPAERAYMALLRSNISLLVAAEECGLYTANGKYMIN